MNQGSGAWGFRILGLGPRANCEHDAVERVVPILRAQRPGQPPDSLHGKKDAPKLLADLQLLCFGYRLFSFRPQLQTRFRV